ncbi:MAG: hypothetical protein ABF479_16650, partial [Gluconacetobacter sp.]
MGLTDMRLGMSGLALRVQDRGAVDDALPGGGWHLAVGGACAMAAWMPACCASRLPVARNQWRCQLCM